MLVNQPELTLEQIEQLAVTQAVYAERIHAKFHHSDKNRYIRYMDTLSRWRGVALSKMAVADSDDPSIHLFTFPAR